jgi:hypothetical protein
MGVGCLDRLALWPDSGITSFISQRWNESTPIDFFLVSMDAKW